MKIDALLNALEALSAHSGNDAKAVEQLAAVARAFGRARTVKVFLASIEDAAKDASTSAFGPTLSELRNVVATLSAITDAIGTKSAREEVAEFHRLARAYPSARLQALSLPKPSKGTAPKKPPDPLRQELVSGYKNEIEGLRLGSAELTAVLERLAGDKRMRGVEMAALASSVAYETSASTKRPESLRRIRQRHESYLTSAAKSEALKGSSAT